MSSDHGPSLASKVPILAYSIAVILPALLANLLRADMQKKRARAD